MSNDNESQALTLIRKRTFDIAFLPAQAAFRTIVPQVSQVLCSAKSYWDRCLSGVSEYVSGQLQDWYDDTQPRDTEQLYKRKHSHRDGETHEERQARRAQRRQARAHARSSQEGHHAVVVTSLGSPAHVYTRTTSILETKLDKDSQPRAHSQIINSRLRRESIRTIYERTVTSRQSSSFSGSLRIANGSASNLQRESFAASMKEGRSSRSALYSRSSKDAANILNRITPHKSRISKSKRGSDVQSTLPFTKVTLPRYLQSPTADSPIPAYRSPGAPLPSPIPEFNPFKTRGSSKTSARTEEQSLEDLIAQLRKEHPHQYEWQKIDREKTARNEEIARKRGLLKPSRSTIPVETATRVEKALRGHFNHEDVLVAKFNQEITVKDLSTLKYTAWLNDEVINFYMNLIVERAKLESKLKIHAFNTFFFSKLVSGGYKDVRRWAKKAKVDIASCDLVIVPVHLGVHWCMAAVNAQRKRFEYWDSLQGGAGRAFTALREYMKNEAPSVDISGWADWIPETGPRQKNGYDCGVFACQTAESISRSTTPDFTQDEMPELRKRMAASILDATLY